MKIYFDLETTGLRRDNPQIIQIAAECKNGVFNRYLRPTIKIKPGASKVNGLFVKKGDLIQRKNGQIEILETHEMSEGLQDFFDWASNQGDQPTLCAYNGTLFDFPILELNIQRFDVDTHGILERREDPIRTIQNAMGRTKFPKLSDACEHFGIKAEIHQFHDAQWDCKALRMIMKQISQL